MRAVRELLGEKQPAFAQRLTTAARQLGMPWLSYDNTIVSKLELGTRDLSIDDAVVVAAIDPQRRGKPWVAWDENGGAELLDPAKDRKASDEELDRATQAAERARREEASRTRRLRGKRRPGGA